MKIRLGVDTACRSAHHAACADESGRVLWSGQRFRTDVVELEALWARLPVDAEEVMVVMEPTRNAWVPLAAWFRRQGAVVVLVPSEQSSDLPARSSQARSSAAWAIPPASPPWPEPGHSPGSFLGETHPVSPTTPADPPSVATHA